ncbi:MAG TPA: gliding motility-associated C-terminal domain-containing protein [Bacteroidales bacterium]|nr:gliding motility-associated C-terminal domain-containing protein [Bacteroidales bacterium]
MNKISNNGQGNFDDYLRNMLDNYQPDVSSNLWDALKLKLFKKDVLDFVSFKKLKRSFSSQKSIGAAQIKVLVGYAVAACFTVAMVFGANYIYKNVISDKPDKKVNHGRTVAPLIKPDLPVFNDTQVSVAPQNIPVVSEPLRPKEITSVSAVNRDDQKSMIKKENAVEPEGMEKTDKAGTHAQLIDYIDRVNSKDKTVNEEADVVEYPEIVELDIDENTELKPEDNDTYAYNLEIPNVFTPNGDGFNDYFVIRNLDKYPVNSLTIADRNGKVVYEVTNYQNKWDARDLNAGTYYYILSYKDSRKNQGMIKGIISVVR